MLTDKENTMKEICTFKPKINKLNRKSMSAEKLRKTTRHYSNIFEKLNDEYHINKTNKINRTIKKLQEENELNPKTKSYNNQSDYYNKLYDDASVQQKKKLELINNVYLEQGITFTPKINDKKMHNIKTNFDERNQKLIELKQQILAKMNDTSKKRTLSREKIIENNQRVVERLYKKEMEKITENRKKAEKAEKELSQKKKIKKKMIESEVTTSYKENLRKNHKISFKNNYLSNENIKTISFELGQNDINSSNHTESSKKLDERDIERISEIPLNIDFSVKKEVSHTKHSSFKNSYILQTNQDNKELGFSHESILLAEVAENSNEEKLNVLSNLIKEENKSEIKEIKENEDNSKSLIEVKSKTLQNLLNKNKK